MSHFANHTSKHNAAGIPQPVPHRDRAISMMLNFGEAVIQRYVAVRRVNIEAITLLMDLQ